MALNPACDVAGYALAPASVIAPVTGMDRGMTNRGQRGRAPSVSQAKKNASYCGNLWQDIVWNTVIAPCSLGETLTPRRLISAAIIFFTATTSAGGLSVCCRVYTIGQERTQQGSNTLLRLNPPQGEFLFTSVQGSQDRSPRVHSTCCRHKLRCSQRAREIEQRAVAT